MYMYNAGYGPVPKLFPNGWVDQSYGYNNGRQDNMIGNQPQNNLIAGRVNGRAGALNSQIDPNTAGLFLDETAPILWIKSADSSGRAILNGYNLSPIAEEETIDQSINPEAISKLYDKLDKVLDRIDTVERRIDGLNKSSAPAIKQKQRPISNNQPGSVKGVGDVQIDQEF